MMVNMPPLKISFFVLNWERFEFLFIGRGRLMHRLGILLIFVVMVCFARTSEARKFALLVGVDEYDAVLSLKCCVNDMKTLKEALMKIGFEEDDIQVLVTGSAGRDYPTKKKIERRISEVLSAAGPKDLVFLAFSGTGLSAAVRSSVARARSSIVGAYSCETISGSPR